MNHSQLRPYQAEALQKLRIALAGGKRRVMLYSPTGSGKTEIAMAMIAGARAKGKRVAFVANRVELVGQASRRFFKSGIDHGVIQGENSRCLDSPVLVCSIQTISRRGLPDVDLIVIDEAHGCAGSREYRELIRKHNALPIIGLSATPFAKGLGRHHDGIGELFEDMVQAATIRDLIERGHLVDCDIYAPSEPDLSGVKIVAGDYNEQQLGVAVDRPALIGDIVSHWNRLGRDKQTVCFATNIAHSKHIIDQFRASGIAAEHLDCYTSDEEREGILGRVSSGETKIVSNVGVLAEGWDCPAVSVMILARPTRSLIRYIQMVGRVLRPFPGKERALILDHSGTVSRLGFPTDDLPLELDDGKQKESAGPKKREEPLPKPCPSCSYMKPPKVHKCPSCGFAPVKQSDIVPEEGTLVKKAPKRALGDKQEVYSMLIGIRMKHGYARGWCAHKYREIFGVWPRGLSERPREPSPEVLSWVRSRQIRYAKGVARAA